MRQLVRKCFDVQGLVIVERRMGFGRQVFVLGVREEVNFGISKRIESVNV